MMKPKKSFAAPPIVVVSTAAPPSTTDGTDPLLIALPENPLLVRTLDLRRWIGKGIDGWVYACAGQLRAFLSAKSVAPSTVSIFYSQGLTNFFRFLVATGGPTAPGQLEPRHLRLFVGWLCKERVAKKTKKKRYDSVKSVLMGLVRRKLIPSYEGLFPNNPWPGCYARGQGEKPLTFAEHKRLVEALRDDLTAINRGEFDGTNSSTLVVYLLGIAIRCGANPTPLLEATRDGLQDHPFIPTMKRLVLFKRRGNASKVLQLRCNDSVSVPMDGVALFNKALEASAALVEYAKPEHRNRVWLYRALVGSTAGKVVPLWGNTLLGGIAALVRRHDLRDDNGDPLRLNLSRLRKTVEMRLFELSGGDLVATAAMMGHAPKVADNHYLSCTQQMRENATFVGEALPGIYRSEANKKGEPIPPGPTPTGRCQDPYQGDKAPKDGSPCDAFFSCFSCRSYAITGSPDDLHRLFSFYFFLEREAHKARTEDWRSEFRYTMQLIDRFTANKFGKDAVAAARERARNSPIRFWAAYVLPEETIDV